LTLFVCVLLLLQNMKDASVRTRSSFGKGKHFLGSIGKPDTIRSSVDAKIANVS
jgi:hypothetical protein